MAVVPLVQGLDQMVPGSPERGFDLLMTYSRAPDDIDRPVEQMIGVGDAANGPVVSDGSEGAAYNAVGADEPCRGAWTSVATRERSAASRSLPRWHWA